MSHTLQRFKVAYKGGNLEKNLLQSLGIPSINLELIEGFQSFKNYAVQENQTWYFGYYCGQHKFLDPPETPVLHCPQMETAYYRDQIIEVSISILIQTMRKRVVLKLVFFC